jgi:hypothetical protein
MMAQCVPSSNDAIAVGVRCWAAARRPPHLGHADMQGAYEGTVCVKQQRHDCCLCHVSGGSQMAAVLGSCGVAGNQ